MALPHRSIQQLRGCHEQGMDQKKSQKKEPTKTLKEKRAAKQEKKGK